MSLKNEPPNEDDLADSLWRAIATIQAITDRLLAQCEKSTLGQGDDPYCLASLVADPAA